MWRPWRTADAEARLARRVTLLATVLFLVVVCRWQPWNLFADTGFSNNFYDEQARAFWHLRLDVPASVAGPEGFLIDGKTYLYYGPMLALVRLPFSMVGHVFDGRLTRISMVLAFVAACTATFHLGRRLAATIGAEQRSHRRIPMLVLAVAVSPMLALAGWTSVYHETELWAFAGFLATIAALAAARTTPSTRHLTWAGAFAVATVLTRASVGFGALAAVGITGLLLWRSHRHLAWTALGAATGGFVLNVVLNTAKFGTLVDLPADRQLLSLQNPARAAWFAGNGGSFFSLRFLPTTVVQYLRPDGVRFERLVPFVRFGPLAHQFGSYPLEGNTPASSLTSSGTLLFLAAGVGLVLAIRRRHWHLWPWMLGAVVAAVPTFLIGFVANRYLTDLLPLLVIPAAVAFTAWQVQRVRAARAGFVVLAGWGVWCNVSLAVWTSELKNPTFTSVRYRLDDAVFGGVPPSVITLAPGAPVPRDGVVAIDGDCAGLYIAEQGAWVGLERADGVRHVRGATTMPALGEEAILAGTPDGDLVLVRDDAGVRVRYEPVNGEPVRGAAVASAASGTIDVDLVSDPVAGGLTVRLDGRLSLFAYAAPSLADAQFGDQFVPAATPDRGTPICHSLQERRS